MTHAPFFPRLFTRGRIGSMILDNRLCMAPIGTRFADDDGFVTGRLLDFYAERARGGIGLVIVEATYIHPYPGRMLISDDRYIPGLARLVDAIHEGGSKASIEIQTRRGRSDAAEPLGPSAVAHPRTGRVPRALSEEDIAHIVADFGRAAKRARDAGFDCIEIHGGSGYLLNEFLSPLANVRRDAYGGSLEHRARMALEIVARVKADVGASFPVIYRQCADERVPGGIPMDEAVAFAQLLEHVGIDAIEVVSGSTVHSPEWIVMPLGLPEGANVPLAEAIKKAVSVPVITGGNLADPGLAEEVLASGRADFITIGKALIADPAYPRKLREGRLLDVRPCTKCLLCTDPRIRDNVGIRCSVNPRVGREHVFPVRAAKERRRFAVVGGGVAGMQAALVLAARGHRVEIFERATRLGGDLRLDSFAPYLADSARLVAYFERQLVQHDVAVRTGLVIGVDAIEIAAADGIVVATGGVPIMLPIARVEASRVVTFREAMATPGALGPRVIVFGSNLAACKVAELARDAGHAVTMIGREPVFGSAVEETVRRVTLARLRSKEVVTRIVAELAAQPSPLHADTLICALGLTPDLVLPQALLSRGRAAYAVGDCANPGTLKGPIEHAFEAAFEIP